MTWDFPVLLLSAVSLPLIIILHLLARRRRTLTVPSLLLWERLMENEWRSVTLRRFLADLLLILQLLAALLLVLSLAGPRPSRAAGRINGPTVLVLDISAGMSAVEGDSETRFDIMMDLAVEMIRNKAPGAEVSILAGAAGVIPLTGFTSSRSELLTVLKDLKATDEPGDPDLALRTAIASATAKAGGRVVFFTDAAFDDKPRLGGITEIVTVGTPGENAGITAFAVRGLPEGGRELLVTVENFGIENRIRRLLVRIDDREILAETMSLPPGGSETRTLFWNDPLAGRVSAQIEGDESDILSSDDEVFAVLTSEGRIRTALITPGNWFLETLLKTHPNISLVIFRGLESWREDNGTWDLVIADRLYPVIDPGIPLLALYPFPEGSEPPLPLLPQGILNGADPVNWDSDHPLMRGADLSRVSVRTAVSLATGPEVRILAGAVAGPLIMAGESDNRRWVAFSFDLLESSLPLRPAFPILISGALSWLTPGDMDSAADLLRAGENWLLPSEFQGAEPEIFGPDGKVEPETDFPDRVGFWTALSEGARTETGVSLLNAEESDIRPRWEPDGSAGGLENRETMTRTPVREKTGTLTTILIVLAFLLVLSEWFFQSRYWRNT